MGDNAVCSDAPTVVSPRFSAVVMVLAAVVAAVALLLALVRTGGKPTIAMRASSAAIGRKTSVTIDVAEPGRGVSNVSAELVQGTKTTPLGEISFPVRPVWAFWGPRTDGAAAGGSRGRTMMPGLTRARRSSSGGRPRRHLAAPSAARGRRDHAAGAPHAADARRGRRPRLRRAGRRGGGRLHASAKAPLATACGRASGSSPAIRCRPARGTAGPALRAVRGALRSRRPVAGSALVARTTVGNQAEATLHRPVLSEAVPHRHHRGGRRFLAKVVPEIMAQTPDLADRGSPLDNYLADQRRAAPAQRRRAQGAGRSARPNVPLAARRSCRCPTAR